MRNSSYFNHGIVFEPHLQNILINLDKNKFPQKIYIRDLEGTKLCDQFWQKSQFNHLSENNINALFYTEEKSWSRLIYCLIINNLATAIHYLSDGVYEYEILLWQTLKDILISYKNDNLDNTYLCKKINHLLTDNYLPYKANLLTRFLKDADKNAQYINFENPFMKV